MPSRTKKAQGINSEGGDNQPWATMQADGAPPPAAGGLNGQPGDPPSPDAGAKKGRRTSRRALRNWRVRSRLLLLIVIPTASAVVLGSISITASVRNALAYQRVETLATLGQHIVALSQALEDERDQIVVFIAMGANAGGRGATDASPQLSVIHQEFGATNRAAAQVRSLAGKIDESYSPQARQAAKVALTSLDGLSFLRSVATKTKLPALVVVQEYTNVIDDVLALNDQIAQAASDPSLAQTVHVLGLVSAMQEVASEQRAILAAALLQGAFGAGQQSALQAAQSAQQSDLASFNISASVSQQQIWNNSVNRSFVYQANAQELQAVSLQDSSHSLTGDPTSAADWYGSMSNTVDIQMGSVAHQLTNAVIARAGVLRRGAIETALVIGAAVLLVLLLALIFTIIIGRSMVRPLRRLRAGALDVAGIRLPDTVRRMSEADHEVAPTDVEPIDVDSTDEIGEVARAFDQVHREALRLAANEAALRGNVNAMFVNLSRRSQSLVERQIRLIDELEQGEQDSERLGSLFQMDHLATRMRRNSENLLVLAGHDSSRRWNQPVPLVDVLRAAISEIEQYERVTLNVQPGIAVRGQAVNDVVHLLAELAENATSFSSADTPVNVSGHLLTSGGVLLDISDLGVGMGTEEMAHANWRLDNPPVVDVAVSRRMGLFVVARLAARHGIRVRLRPATGVGLTALVWLPDEVVVHEGAARSAGPGRFPEPLARFAIGSGAGSNGPARPGALAGGGGPAGPVGVGSGDWPATGQSTAEQEVAAARTPRFAPPQAEEDAGIVLGPQRVPGAGPYPGRFGPTTTGPNSVIVGDSTAAYDEPAAFAEYPPVSSQPMESQWPASAAAGTGEWPVQPAAAAGTSEPAQSAADWTADQPAPWTTSQPAQPAAAWTGDQPSQPAAAWPGDQASQPAAARPSDQPEPAVLSAPAARGSTGSFLSRDSRYGSKNGGVIIPPAASVEEDNRLPIFEAVESDWFRRGRPALDSSADQAERAPAKAWSSPADEGWKVAEAAVAPVSGGTTVAGLPRRVPKANLIPGTAQENSAPAPVRSASATRDRFASLQRGMREGRAASGVDKDDGTADVPSDG